MLTNAYLMIGTVLAMLSHATGRECLKILKRVIQSSDPTCLYQKEGNPHTVTYLPFHYNSQQMEPVT